MCGNGVLTGIAQTITRQSSTKNSPAIRKVLKIVLIRLNLLSPREYNGAGPFSVQISTVLVILWEHEARANPAAAAPTLVSAASKTTRRKYGLS